MWPTIAYIFMLYSEMRTNLSYGHPLIPRCPDKRGLTVLFHPGNQDTSSVRQHPKFVAFRGFAVVERED